MTLEMMRRGRRGGSIYLKINPLDPYDLQPSGLVVELRIFTSIGSRHVKLSWSVM
jgi:hypothetical protein